MHLGGSVATVNTDVSTSSVTRRIRRQVEVSADKLLHLTLAAEGSERVPLGLGGGIHKVRNLSSNVARGNRVDTGKASPFNSKRSAEVSHTGLSSIVRRLHLGEVDNVTRHGRGRNKRTRATFLEMSANVLGTVVDTVKVKINNLIPLAIVLSVNQRTSSPGNTSIGNKNVNLAKLLDLLLDGSLNSGTVIDSNLVGLSLDTVLFRKRLGLCIGIVRVVPNGEVNPGSKDKFPLREKRSKMLLAGLGAGWGRGPRPVK